MCSSPMQPVFPQKLKFDIWVKDLISDSDKDFILQVYERDLTWFNGMQMFYPLLQE